MHLPIRVSGAIRTSPGFIGYLHSTVVAPMAFYSEKTESKSPYKKSRAVQNNGQLIPRGQPLSTTSLKK